MNKKLLFIKLIFLLLISACSNDDFIPKTAEEEFISDALTTISSKQLEGKWAIFKVEFEGKRTNVPISFTKCGRDFFEFKTNDKYTEYIFKENYKCTPQINTFNWSLSNGIISINNNTEQWVVTELSSNQLIFKLRIDTNSDGILETFKAICYRYTPPNEIDSYSESFYWDNTIDNQDKIVLKWNPYKGYNQFEKYEIYRLDANCDIANAELISTITNVNQSSFIDTTPPAFDKICYFLKVYTNKGILSESNIISIDTSYIEGFFVKLSEPILNNVTVNLNWEKYKGYYFSHYEIVVKNYAEGYGSGFQENQLAIINNIENTNYTTELPYFENPVFVVYVYNIFGNRSQIVIENENQQSTNFIRKGILPVSLIESLVFSPNESVVYFCNNINLFKYNYETNSIEKSIKLNSSSIIFVKIFKSSFGTEIMVNIGGDIKVYDTDLNFKYTLKNSQYIRIEHFTFNENGYWIATDREKLYSFSRDNSKLTLISKKNTYNQHFNGTTINIINLDDSRILVGNHTKPKGLIINIDDNGLLSNAISVNMNITSEWKNNSLYSKELKYILNVEENKLYSTDTYNLITTLNPNFFPLNINNNGSLIIGTNNNPNSSNDNFHEKKIRTLSYPNFNEKTYKTKGYPHAIYKNHLGQLVSISKALIGELNYSSPENDIFIEVIE